MIKGCTTSTACNYNSDAKEDDNSCIDPLGCDNWCPGDTTDVKELDCADVCGGLKFIDCTGECGILVVDECGVCGGNNSICTDCNGVIAGSAYKDNCSICVDGDTGLEACTYDCTGYWGGDAQLDACGVCGGTNIDDSQCTECPSGQALGCNNSCYPTDTQPINDECNVCGGDNTICAGCDGIPNSGLEIDVCGVCEGDGICLPENCTNDNISGFCQDLSVLQKFIDNSSGTLNMDMDENGNGVIEPLELGGTDWVDGRLTSFTCLDCGLSGEIPSEIGSLENLTILTLGYNQLTGSIPLEIGNLENLTNLTLSLSDLAGAIPVEIGNLMDLTYLNLADNQLTGEIPSEIGNLTNLTSLVLSNNQFSGEIPSEIWNIVNLTYLALNSNEFTGEIPAEIGSLVNLTSLWLGDNEFTGEIPPEIGSLTNLYHLSLYLNQLTGEIPAEIGNLNLIQLGLGNNQLSGEIPVSICNLELTWLSLIDNNLCPPYPECIIEDVVGEQDTSECPEIVTDYDGNNYEIIQIGDQIWMAENLKTTHYNDGSEISTGYSNEEWTELETGAYAVYNDDPSNAAIYGNLYNWFAVDDDKGVCPEGWHVATNDEWTILTDYLGGQDAAGGKMKSTGSVEGGDGLWASPNEGATNESGFTGLPAGYRSSKNGSYDNMGYNGYFWSSSEEDNTHAVARNLYNYRSHIKKGGLSKEYGYSLRCVAD